MKRSEEKLYWNSMRFKPLEGIDEIMSHTSDLDTNHVVFHSRMERQNGISSSLMAESTVVEWFKHLHLRNSAGWCGEMVSGSSEGILVSLWHLREKFHSAGASRTIVLVTQYTHFSVIKACGILSLETVIVSSLYDGSFDVDALKNSLTHIRTKEPHAAIIVVGTLGYTMTGASDNPTHLGGCIRLVCGESLSGLHLDAAIGGLCTRFLNPSLALLDDVGVDSIACDFHKSGMCPFGTAICIMRKNVFLSAGMDVPYHRGVRDYALLGSRSSLPALAAKFVIESTGNNWKKIFERVISLRDRLGHGLAGISSIKIISWPTDVPMLTLALLPCSTLTQAFVKQIFQSDFFPSCDCNGVRYEHCFRVCVNRQVLNEDVDNVLNCLQRC